MPVWLKSAYFAAVCYVGYKDRYRLLMSELARVGVRKVHGHWSFPTPYRDLILRSIPHIKMLSDKPGCWGATWTHYKVLKTAFELGYDYAFIVEDDCRFLKDTKKVWSVLDLAPSDWDILMLDSFSRKGELRSCGNQWYACKSAESTGCYIVNRKGMSRLIQLYEEPIKRQQNGAIMRNSDHWTNVDFLGKDIKFYVSVPNLAIQVPLGNVSNCGNFVFNQYREMGLDISAYGGENV